MTQPEREAALTRALADAVAALVSAEQHAVMLGHHYEWTFERSRKIKAVVDRCYWALIEILPEGA